LNLTQTTKENSQHADISADIRTYCIPQNHT